MHSEDEVGPATGRLDAARQRVPQHGLVLVQLNGEHRGLLLSFDMLSDTRPFPPASRFTAIGRPFELLCEQNKEGHSSVCFSQGVVGPAVAAQCIDVMSSQPLQSKALLLQNS